MSDIAISKPGLASQTLFDSHSRSSATALSLVTMWFCFALLPVTFAASLMDERLVHGISVWSTRDHSSAYNRGLTPCPASDGVGP